MILMGVQTKEHVTLGTSLKILDGVNKGKRCKLLGYSKVRCEDYLIQVKVEEVGYRVYSPKVLGLEIGFGGRATTPTNFKRHLGD